VVLLFLDAVSVESIIRRGSATPIVGDDESDVSRTREIFPHGVVDFNDFEILKSLPCGVVDILNKKRQNQPERQEEEIIQVMTSSSSMATSVVGSDGSDVSHVGEISPCAVVDIVSNNEQTQSNGEEEDAREEVMTTSDALMRHYRT
jgi:hypothetical protein